MNEQDVIQEPMDGSVDLTKELYDKINEETKLYTFTSTELPDGSTLKSSGTIDKKDGKNLLMFEFTYRPNVNANPSIPNDLLSNGVNDVMKKLLTVVPELMSYPKEVLDTFTFEVYSLKIFYMEGLFDLLSNMLLDTVDVNKFTGKYKLTDLIDNPSEVNSTYYIERPPTFDRDYSMMMKRGIKKMKVTFQALRKGTWKGHTYEYEESPWSTNYMVFQDYNNYNKSDKIIRPEFRYSISPGTPKIDGEHWSKTFDAVTMDEFETYIKERFKLLGIRFS